MPSDPPPADIAVQGATRPLLNRIASEWREWFGGNEPVTASAAPAAATSAPSAPTAMAAMTALGPHAGKLMSATAAVGLVRNGDHVFVGTACATPRTLVAALEALELAPVDVELVHFLTDQAVPHDANHVATTRYRHRSFFVGNDMRSAMRQGLADYVPISIARVPHLMHIGRIRVDVALIQVSPPDEFGYVSLGVSVDVIPAAVARARLVIAEINPAMPRTMGDSTLHLDQIHALVAVDVPVIEYTHPATPTQVVEQIARYISGIIEDGSTLQIGLGRVTNEALKHLADRKDLGIHSDVITDAIIPLLERGILTGARKTQQARRIVTSFAMGSRRLYELIDRNPLFAFQPIEAVCNAATIAAQYKMVSVTQAFAVDLTGQVCVDQLQGQFYGGVAAQAEFLQGASRSEGGKAIICLAATEDDGQASRIRPVLLPGEGVAIARTDVHYVITEFGIAYLFGKSIRERALALIDVAHPHFRAALFDQARALGYVGEEQTRRNMRAYAVEEEHPVTLRDQRAVLLRPATSVDGEHIRELFHGLSQQDVYTRFFRRVRGLSNRDIQRLCNLNFDTEVAFVAVSGTRENPRVVAHACYFVEPSTNLAETAFMVLPEWQSTGLATALQQHMMDHAKKRGVRGFVAEILADNTKMIRLARAGSESVTVDHQGSTVRVTQVF